MSETPLRTLCQLCHTNCGLIVRRGENGRISIKGDPDHPVNRGRCCAKALANIEILGSPDRIKHPLQRTPTGFKRISWDEALTIAAEKLGDIRSRFGPPGLARCTGAPVSYQCRDGFLEFMGAYGSPNLTGVGNLCMAPRMTAFKAVTGGIRAEPDYDRAELVIFWGCNPMVAERFSAYAAYGGQHRILPSLKKRQAKTICVDPFRTSMARQADEWVRIRPGADAALGLAMIHLIIKEKLYDHDFVTAHAGGFDRLTAHVEPFSPRWAAEPTGLAAETIENLARTYAGTKPAAVHEGNGLDMYANGVDAVRAIAILIALTGNLDAPGGNVFMPFPHPSALPTRPALKEQRIGFQRFPLPAHVPFPAVKDALLNEEPDRPRAMIVHHGNPVLVQANEERTRRALRKLDFLMVCDIFPTATSEAADLVLPMTSDFEAHGYRGYSSAAGGLIALARPIVDPVGESRSVFEVEFELAQRMNLHEGYPFQNDRSWIDFMIRPTGTTFERLEAEQILYVTPPVQYKKYLEKGFETPSGKVEFHSLWFEKLGAAPLPAFSAPAGEPLDRQALAAKGFTLLGTSRRPARFVHTKFKNLPKTAQSYPEPLVYLHPRDAWERGVKDGAEVEVRSPGGRIVIKAKRTEDTTPGLVWIDFGWGNPTDGLANINRLVNDQFMDPISGGTPNRLFPCEVRLHP
ncbi:MAG: molybdopterin-dependent oxidoreductase [Pseudomonadota bacterium]